MKTKLRTLAKTMILPLLACTAGDAGGQLAVGAVATGIGITVAATAGSGTNNGVKTATQTIDRRANQGAAGNTPTNGK